MTCNVKGCGNYLAKTKKIKGNSIKYFSFPKDPVFFNKWRQACGKENISSKYCKLLLYDKMVPHFLLNIFIIMTLYLRI